MVIEKRHSITLDEINAFQFECKKCRVKTIIPVTSDVQPTGVCRHCGATWFAPMPQIVGVVQVALNNFVKAVTTIASHSEEIACIFSVEIKGEDDGEGT
jgi:hypothetical protein